MRKNNSSRNNNNNNSSSSSSSSRNNNNKKQKVDLTIEQKIVYEWTNDMFGIYLLSREKYTNEEEKKQRFKTLQILKLLDKYQMEWNTLLERIPILNKILKEEFKNDVTKLHLLLETNCEGEETNTWHKIGCTHDGFKQCQKQSRYKYYPTFEAVWDLSNTIITVKTSKSVTHKPETLKFWRKVDEVLVEEFVVWIENQIHSVFSKKGYMELKAGGSRDRRHEEIYGLSLDEIKPGISDILNKLKGDENHRRLFTESFNKHILKKYRGFMAITDIEFRYTVITIKKTK